MKSFKDLVRICQTRFPVYKSFLVTYLVIVLIFAISIGCTYIIMFHTVDEYEGKSMDSHLEQSQKILKQHLSELDSLPSQLIQNTAVSSFLNSDIYNLNSEVYAPTTSSEILSILSNYKTVNLLLDDIILFSPYTDKIINSHAGFNGVSGYGTLFSLENFTFEGVKSSFLKEYSHNRLFPEMKVTINDEQTKDILHITSLSPYNRGINGSCIIFINSEQLISMLEQSYRDKNAYIYFYNKEGELLSKSANAPNAERDVFTKKEIINLAGEKYLVRSSKNTDTWNITIAMPYRYTLRDSLRFKKLILLIAFFSIFTCITLAFAFAKFNYSPIRNIFQKVAQKNGEAKYASNPNEFNAIFGAVENLLNNEQSAHDAFEQNLPILQMNFVQNLLHGEFSATQEIEETAKKLRLDIRGKVFAPLIVCIESANTQTEAEQMERTALAKAVIIQSLSAKTPCLHCDFNSNGIAFIASFFHDDSSENLLLIEETVQAVSDLLFSSQSIHLISAVGDFCLNLSDIVYSYKCAEDYIDNGMQTTMRHNTWCTPNVSGFSWYYYPIEIENKLINCFLGENMDGVYEILNAVYDENANTRILSGNMISCLYSDIRNTIYKLLSKTNIHELPENINSMLSNTGTIPISEFFRIVEDVFAEMDEQNRQESRADISKKILNYVDNTALSPDFGRLSVAEHFYISEEYVSKYFKENTGFNFLEYVTKIRMTTAQQMLLDGNYTVNKIAEAVGYNSAIAFRRAFKAYTGNTPVEWRRQQDNNSM